MFEYLNKRYKEEKLKFNRYLCTRIHNKSTDRINRYKIMYIECAKSISTTDHKIIGRLYMVFGGLASVLGTFFSILIRIQLANSNSELLLDNYHYYNSIITLHGIIMIFMVVMPIMIGGFGNIFLPIMIGSPEVAFPRLNNMSF